MSTATPADEVLGWLDRWSAPVSADARGTLRHVTAAARLRGAAAVRTGEVVSCAWPIDAATVPGVSISSGPDPVDERIAVPLHGFDVTHLDALSHGAADGRYFGGLPATELGVDGAPDGVVTRGVLLDVAALTDRPWLDAGEGVGPAELEAAERSAGVRVEPGDAVLLSTGFSAFRRRHPGWTVADGAPGWHAAALPWLRERAVALVATDGAQDVLPSGYPEPELEAPLHRVGIVALGLWLLDNCDLERLTERCRALARGDFLFVVAPLRLVGATGSPVNPLAIL